MSSENPHLDAARAHVLAEIGPSLPDTWDVRDALPPKGTTLTRPSLFLDFSGVQTDAPSLGADHVYASLEALVVSPSEVFTTAQEAVDLDVARFIGAIVRHPTIICDGAKKRTFDDRYVAWIVDLRVLCLASPTPTEPEE